MDTIRPICPFCNQNARAINYVRNSKYYYRSCCEKCLKRKRHKKPPQSRWQLCGYQKKKQCDLCGFFARYKAQLLVYHLDGNLNNCALNNLRTICLNCTVTVNKNHSVWKRGDLESDI